MYCSTYSMDVRHEETPYTHVILKLQAREMVLLRKVEGVTRLDRMKNEDARRSLGQEAVYTYKNLDCSIQLNSV